jgi:hypothetical protein
MDIGTTITENQINRKKPKEVESYPFPPPNNPNLNPNFFLSGCFITHLFFFSRFWLYIFVSFCDEKISKLSSAICVFV